MNDINLVYIIGMFLIPFMVLLIPVFIGRKIGVYFSHKSDTLQKAPLGAVVGLSFSMLTFLTAFTFSIAFSHHTTRKNLMLDEISNIRTTYMRAGLLPETVRSNVQKLLVEYVDLRVEVSNNMSTANKNMQRSQQILDALWAYVEATPTQDRGLAVNSFFTTSVINLTDIYNKRVILAFDLRIPKFAIWLILLICFLTMLSLGFQFGITDKGSAWITLFLATIFAIVMCLILALDRPELGLGKMDPKPMTSLKHQLQLK